jgi:ribosomal protein S14
MEWFFIGWIVLSILCGVYASSKGRSGVRFFFLALCLSPLIGFIAAAIASPNVKKQDDKKLQDGQLKKCPFCAELVKQEAKVCRFCNREFPSEAVIGFNRDQWNTTNEGRQAGAVNEDALINLIHNAYGKGEKFNEFFLCEKLIERFPNAPFAEEAKNRIEAFKKVFDEKYHSTKT